MPKRQGGRHKSHGGNDGGGGGGGRGRGGGRGGGGGGRGGGGGGRGGGGGGGKQGKILYNSGDEPSFIRQFKERTGYQAPPSTDEKRRMFNDDEQPRDGDYRKDDEKPQIVQLNSNDLSKEEVDIELAKAKEVEEEKQCIDSTGRLLFRKPKEKSDEIDVPPTKSEIVEIASNKTIKRKNPTTQKETDLGNSKKAKSQLLSFMDETGFDGDD